MANLVLMIIFIIAFIGLFGYSLYRVIQIIKHPQPKVIDYPNEIKFICYLLVGSGLASVLIFVFMSLNNLFPLNGGEWVELIIGSLLFGIGLFSIIHMDLWLYTGRVGKLLDNKISYVLDLIICFIGNAIGCFILALMLKETRIGEHLIEVSNSLVIDKMEDSWYSILFLSILCGVMIYLACYGHKKCEYPIGKVIFVFLAVSVFILCSFEHVVANVCYFTYSDEPFKYKMILYFIIMFIGNGIGSVIIDGALKLTDYLKKKKVEDDCAE